VRAVRSRASEQGREEEDVAEHTFECPYCWQSITMLVDTSVPDQEYVEDCEVCCNPIAIHVRASGGRVTGFDAQRLP
jgi:hypothetical protein